MKYSKLFFAPSLLMSWLASAQPSFIVSPYLQNPATDAMSVLLETNDQNVQLHYRERGTEQPFITIMMNKIASSSTIHRARIDNLNSSTRYQYYVTTDGGDSDIWGFKTWPVPSDNQETIKILSFSDSQGNHVNRLGDIVNNGMVPNNCNNDINNCDDEIAAIIVPGDIVQTGSNINQWRTQFFGQAAPIFARVPVIPAIGNHDYALTNYTNYFELPSNSTGNYEEQWHSFDYLNLRIITLNSNTTTNTTLEKQQRLWLDPLLEDTTNNSEIDYVMLQIHHPCKSELWVPGEKDLTCEYVRKFEDISAQTGKISGHIFGHTHAYSRGQSRDVSHLWLNAAVSSGDIDYWDEYQMYDYDEFQRSYPEFGYSLLEFGVKQKSMHVKRYSGGDGRDQYWGYQGEGIRDDFVVGGDNFNPEQPTAIAPNGSVIEGNFTLVASEYADADNDNHLESHWQVSSDPEFNTVELDFWGNKTRSENIWRYQNTQAGVALNAYDVNTSLPSGSYHWRVRYRDEHWAWSEWSPNATFEVEDQVYSDNLVLNGDAELGMQHWTVEIGVVESNASGACNGITAQQGANYFSAGGICSHSAVGQAMQEIDLSSFTPEISNGSAFLELAAFIRNYNGKDIPEVWVDVYNSNSDLVTTSSILTNASGTWAEQKTKIELPTSAAVAVVRMKGTRNAGSDNDSYIDSIKLRLGSEPLAFTSSDNLLVNGDAEQGMENWEIEQGVVESNASGACSGITAQQGAKYFSAGGICSHSAVGQAMQKVDLTAYGAVISRNTAILNLQAYIRDWNGNDIPEVWVDLYDDSDTLIASSESLSNTNATWTLKTTSITLPPNTLSAVVRMKGTRKSGSDNDSYIDAISLIITHEEIPAPENMKPVASIKATEEVNRGDTVYLDGSASFDPDNGPNLLSYQWTMASLPLGSKAEIIGSDTAHAHFEADEAGIYHIQLSVTDGELIGNADLVLMAEELPLQMCDVNADFYIDNNDIRAITAKLNTPAEEGDRADWDQNGIVNALDARACMLQCSQIRCAVNN
ncbi:metallophosphoesterase [Paraglaciecola hydrolytica]|uniref:Calcineurin-like phosphoesterase domain-containing protein n=1 Tax=Paraglaciecola hydrolytica TaxID=1799789 RepID=A0A148KKZ0_9ALTE|nr:metallophosphoesterase [Paraglaciecola hydrolytica]KXI26931.1 hypothetical protein AX660_02160 [Paraglaciecola hydrolytica]